jgi:hypothetical protein
MEAIVSIVAILGLITAAIHRAIEDAREVDRRERVLKRTNENPWNRSSR